MIRKSKKILGVLCFFWVALLGASLVSTAFQPALVYAAPDDTAITLGIDVDSNGKPDIDESDFTVRWINAARIELRFTQPNTDPVIFTPSGIQNGGGTNLKDERWADDEVEFHGNIGDCKDDSKIKIEHDEDESNNTLTNQTFKTFTTITLVVHPGPDIECEESDEVREMDFIDPEKSASYFEWRSSNQIGMVDGQVPGSFTQSPTDPLKFYRDTEAGDGACTDVIMLNAAKTMAKWYEMKDSNSSPFQGDVPPEVGAKSSCHYRNDGGENGNEESDDGFPQSNHEYLLTGLENMNKPPDSADQLGGDSVGGDDNVKCEVNGFNLSWLICPIINGSLDGASIVFRSFVEPLLQSTPINTDVSSDNPIMTIWKSFRTIGNIVLIFALLFVVFGQSIGGGLIDAYTAKKTMPRILVAALLINLSIYLCAILVDVFNVLGHGVARLIMAPLKDTGNLKIEPGSGRETAIGVPTVIFVTIFGLLVGGAVFKALSKGPSDATNAAQGAGSVFPYIFLFIVVPIFLAVLGIFLTLVIRRAIIMMLVVISPIALALFAIPGADKYAKKWLDALIKTLMVYPIITGIFGISQVLAVITYNAGETGTITTLLATLIIAFAPLFMIPFAFKLAGGIIGGLANTVRGSRDNLKKMWGDDKHNPHSLRNKIGPAARHKVGTQMTTGLAGSNNRVVGYVGGRFTNRADARQAKAGSKAAEGFATDGGRNVAAKAAGAASKNGHSHDDSVFVGQTSGKAAEAHGVASGEAGAEGALSLMQSPDIAQKGADGNLTQLSKDSIESGTEAAAKAHSLGETDKGRLEGIAHAAASFHQTNGRRMTAEEENASVRAVRAADRAGKNSRHTYLQRKASMREAGKTAATVMGETAARNGGVGDQAAATASAETTARVVAEVTAKANDPADKKSDATRNAAEREAANTVTNGVVGQVRGGGPVDPSAHEANARTAGMNKLI